MRVFDNALCRARAFTFALLGTPDSRPATETCRAFREAREQMSIVDNSYPSTSSFHRLYVWLCIITRDRYYSFFLYILEVWFEIRFAIWFD